MLSSTTATTLSNTDIDNHRTTIKGYFQHQPNPGYPQTPNDVGHYAVPIDTSGSVSILSYGAVANDTSKTSENLSAIQNATQNNAKVEIPDGIFYLPDSGVVRLYSNIKLLWGKGTLKTVETATNSIAAVRSYHDAQSDYIADGLTFEDVRYVANDTPMNNVILQNNTFKATQTLAPIINGAMLNIVSKPTAEMHHIYIYNNHFNDSPRGSIELLMRDFDVSNSRYPTWLTDVQVKGNVSFFTPGNYINNLLNCFCSVSSFGNLLVEDNYVDGEWWGIENENFGSLIVRNNYFSVGLPISGKWQSVDTVIEGNYLHADRTYKWGTQRAIWTGGFVDSYIRNNVIDGYIEINSNTTDQEGRVTDDSTFLEVSGNTITGPNTNNQSKFINIVDAAESTSQPFPITISNNKFIDPSGHITIGVNSSAQHATGQVSGSDFSESSVATHIVNQNGSNITQG